MSFMRSIWPDFIDDDLPLTRKQRKAIHHQAWKLWAQNGWNFVLYLTLPVAYLLLLYATRQVIDATVGGMMGPAPQVLRIASLIVVPAACFIAGGAVLQRFRFAPCVYEATRHNGFDVCAKCGYWLRGLTDDETRCPECGAIRHPMPRPSKD